MKKVLNKIIVCKINNVIDATKAIKNIPTTKNLQKISKANKFEKGLNDFAMRILRRSFQAFKSE
jgi:hypothetical protein